MTARLVRRATVTIDDQDIDVSISTDGDQLLVATGDEAAAATVRKLGPHRWMVRYRSTLDRDLRVGARR